MFHVTIEESGKTAILHCAGRMVRGHETALLCAALGQYERNIVLELSQLDAIDAAGVGALLSLQAAGIYLRLMNPTKAVCEVLRVTKVDSVFEISNSLPNQEQERPARLPFSPVLATAS